MNDYLEHFGILGMHWGIRRFQNEDGTLTPAGIERYRKNKKFADKYDGGALKRKRAEMNSESELKTNADKLLNRISNGEKNKTSKLTEKINKEWTKTKEYKEHKEASDAITEAYLFSDGDLVLTEPVLKYFEELSNKSEQKLTEITNKYIDQVASAYLSDMGYEDTYEGREYLKKLGFTEW